ncbi:hypothetical protein TWF569_009388 [Orbilia oligospora]|uniref:HMG box domain-containing protein n=1 Tax=Orbilia oligospora TaxID=2813651 RepID=A0A7C8IY07_ORBOL|nr:hypothetical protein TWF102_001756 [Orbilia oligospora]KAF3095124.1 hypothetical protein TWF706_007989 [Orbilia oligospora]KAF3121426.1 hypothetical protein TWF703_001916 [Orbilia oligospora]KAF3136759.1 hypothetical protein TWF569_009388 [Orbilia oligospora]
MATTSKCPEIGVKKSRQSHNNKVPPDAPRRNLSSFVIFANTRRKELKALYPDRPYPAIQSDISVEWEKMNDEGKEHWKKLMALDKERYKREMELYRKYGSNWVWVVGHQKRKELGLTVEDFGIASSLSMSAQPIVSSSQNAGDYNLNTEFYGIPASSPSGGRDISDNGSQSMGDLAILGLVDVFSPTVFDGFGLDMPWSETCEWYDQ